MRLPATLYGGYAKLKKSRLVGNKLSDPEALEYFEKNLNAAQPQNDEEQRLYQLVKSMYVGNKGPFMKYINATSKFRCLVLWTESRAIVNDLGLRNVAYVRWDNTNKNYSVSEFKSSTTPTTSYEHPVVIAQRSLHTLEGKNVVPLTKAPDLPPHPQELVTDMPPVLERASASAASVFGSFPNLDGKAWADHE